eukprot:3939659-Pyramimonas_sp.AAC.1
MRSQEASRGHIKTQEVTGCPKWLQEAPGNSGGFRQSQEAPGDHRKRQDATEFNGRPREVPEPGGLRRQQECLQSH